MLCCLCIAVTENRSNVSLWEMTSVNKYVLTKLLRCLDIHIRPIRCHPYNHKEGFASNLSGCVAHVWHVLDYIHTRINHNTVGINYHMRHFNRVPIAQGPHWNSPFMISSVYTSSRLTSPTCIGKQVHVRSNPAYKVEQSLEDSC